MGDAGSPLGHLGAVRAAGLGARVTSNLQHQPHARVTPYSPVITTDVVAPRNLCEISIKWSQRERPGTIAAPSGPYRTDRDTPPRVLQVRELQLPRIALSQHRG